MFAPSVSGITWSVARLMNVASMSALSGPGGLHEGGQYFNCTGGATGYIDRWVFGDNHMYGHPTCKRIYLTETPFDPEGFLGCITATFTVFLGLQAGKIVRTYGHYGQRMRRFACWSAVCGVFAAILCRGSQNDGWIPGGFSG